RLLRLPSIIRRSRPQAEGRTATCNVQVFDGGRPKKDMASSTCLPTAQSPPVHPAKTSARLAREQLKTVYRVSSLQGSRPSANGQPPKPLGVAIGSAQQPPDVASQPADHLLKRLNTPSRRRLTPTIATGRFSPAYRPASETRHNCRSALTAV